MKIVTKLLLAGAGLIAVKGLDNRLEITHYTVRSHKIPQEFDGFKIVHVSDYHCEHIAGLIHEIEEESPDIIVSTGDMVNDYGDIAPAVKFTKRLAEIAPLYMITGNHDVWRSDYGELISQSKNVGGIFLNNETIELERNNSKIALSGISDPYYRNKERIVQHITDAIKKIGTYDGFHIAMFHRANWLDSFKGKGFDLVLSGHMHGGQIRLPVFGGVLSPKTSLLSGEKLLFPYYFGGVYNHDRTKMIVSRGLGNPMVIPRLFNRPELVVITLESKHEKEI